MDTNQRIDQLELTLVDVLQKSDLVADYIRQILDLTVSLENKTEQAGQALVYLLNSRTDMSASSNNIAQQFADIMQTQQELIELLRTRFNNDL